MQRTEPQSHVTVVGGGFSGAIFAHHLLRMSPHPVLIDIAEERASLGAGVAYSADAPHQITNIPAPRMSVNPEDPGHFERWLARTDPAAAETPYPHRSLFGAYVRDLLDTTRPAHPASRLSHRLTRVSAVTRKAHGFAVADGGDAAWFADAVVLATGNPIPMPPPSLARLAGDPRIILDPWRPGALAHVGTEDRILVLGIGLSMGEVVAGLAAAGHRGPVTAIARRGRRPVRGTVEAPPPFGSFADAKPTTAVGLLRRFRSEVRRAEAAGQSSRSVLTAARGQAWSLWASLPSVEQRRFVRHLKPWYEAMRHVMPGPVHDQLEAEESCGRLRLLTASLHGLEADPEGIVASLRLRHTSPDAVLRQRFDVVINCTGPAYPKLTVTDPFWAGLARAGLVRADEVGLGIAVDPHGRAIGADGTAQDRLFVLGTLARGTFGELTGVAELSRLAREAAEALIKSLAAQPDLRRAS